MDAVLHEDEIGREVVDAAFAVHTALGPGLLESAYEAAMMVELRARGLSVANQVDISAEYRGQPLGLSFRADLIVADKVLVELKSVEAMHAVFAKQVLTYLRLGGWKLGYLVNFNQPRLKDNITRIVNGLPE